MKKVLLFNLILSVLLISCSPKETFVELKFNADDGSEWITDSMVLPISDSLFYKEYPSPLFRREFNSSSQVERATLVVSAAGYYKATINGEAIGRAELAPDWTDFSKRVYYSEYDITSQIVQGVNCLGVKTGNGFYNPLPLRKWGRRNLREDLSKVGKPSFIAKLYIQYKDGSSEEIVTDKSWRYNYGPMIKNDAYLGVAYDARREIKGWNKAGFKDIEWQSAVIGEGPGGKLQKSVAPPVEICKTILPIEIIKPQEGVYVVDMGVNFTGTYRIKLKGNTGDTINFRFGERIYEDGTLNPMTTVIGQIKRPGAGGPGAPDIAWQTDRYIIGGEEEELFQPEFTYHTYRYMEIVGLESEPKLDDIKGLFLHSNVDQSNSFVSSSKLINSIQEITERTFLANMISVQSDCPSREKFGYGGDLNATSESFIYNFDMRGFYKKTVYDWLDAMRDSMFVDTAPYAGVKYCGISWESAYLITQHYLYLYYNDKELVKELYSENLAWMDKVAMLHPEGLIDKGLGDHESMIRVPVQLTGTCHYLQCAKIMQTFASEMGDNTNVIKFAELSEKLRKIIKAEFWDKAVVGEINRQTLFSALLFHKVLPKEDIAAAKDSLINALNQGPSGHFSTGIFGTKFILEALSEHASANTVFDIVNSTEYPGWGHMVDKGATTIWETWEESDNTFSNCHPMFGTVTEWYYRWLAGIRPILETPGFEQFIVSPTTPKDLDFVKCSYNSPYGKIVSNWRRTDDKTVVFEITVPQGSSALLSLPLNEGKNVKIQKGDQIITTMSTLELVKSKFILKEGEYKVSQY